MAKFVPKLANSKEYLYSKLEKGLTLEIKENMLVSSSQSYKKVVQLSLKAERLSDERISQKKFLKRKGFGLISGQSSRKSRSFKSFENSSRSMIDSISSL